MKRYVALVLMLVSLLMSFAYAESGKDVTLDTKKTIDIESVTDSAASLLVNIKHGLLDRNSMDVRSAYAWVTDDEWLYVFTYVAKNSMGGLSENEVLVLYNVEKEEVSQYNVTQSKGDFNVVKKFTDELEPKIDEEVAQGRLIMLSLSDLRESMDMNQKIRQAFGVW